MTPALLQFAGIACRVSCANPVLGPSMGVVGIGVASAMAGQAAVHCRHHFKTGQHPFSIPSTASFRGQDMLLDACMGIILYKVHPQLNQLLCKLSTVLLF